MDRPWNFQCVSSNVNIDCEFVEIHKEKNWNYKRLSNYVSRDAYFSDTVFNKIPFEYVLKNKEKEWEWTIIFMNLDWALLEKHMHDFKWNKFYLNYPTHTVR
jgi:hypothetical protein